VVNGRRFIGGRSGRNVVFYRVRCQISR